MSNEREPAEVFPVGHFIKEEMAARGWTLEDLLIRMPGDANENALWLDLVFEAPEMDADLDLALGDPSPLAHAFGTSKEFWTNLDDAWRAARRRPA